LARFGAHSLAEQSGMQNDGLNAGAHHFCVICVRF
jgi:hypothetical protein